MSNLLGPYRKEGLSPALYEWDQILHTYSKEKILSPLESSSE
jgi:hypothetical protein